MTPTLNLTEAERRDLHHVVENELGHEDAVAEDGPIDGDYAENLQNVLAKLEGCR